ncbi:MAG: carboxypeptidase regulatory-like domain-containing protein [Thermoplasmata archaeon]
MRKITSAILVGMLLSMGFIGLFSVPASASYTGYITGTVTDASGVGLYGATVYYTDAYGRTSQATTNATGYYNLSGLAVGVYYVEASMYTYLPSSKIKVAVAADQETSNVNFALSKSGWITGTVTGESGLVSGGNVYVYDITGSTQIAYASIGSYGVYNLTSKLYTGNYLIYAAVSNYPAQLKSLVSVTQGQGTTYNIVLVLGGTITGYVREQDGSLITSITTYSIWATRAGSSSSYCTFNSTTGMYKISGLETGVYSISVSVSAYETKTITDVSVTKSQITYSNITLIKKAYVQGYVKNSAGTALYYATVSLLEYSSDNTDSNGYYNITDVTPGNYTIKSTYSNYVDYTATISIASGEGKWYNITQPSGAYINGYLKDSDGNVITSSYEVRCREQNLTTTSMVDGSSGFYNITGRGLGRYILTAKISGYAQATITVDVTALQGYTDQNITLPAGGYITGTLNISDGTAITSASGTIYAYDADNVSYSDSPYYESTYNITGLKTSTYRLSASFYYSGEYYVLPYVENVSVTQGVGLTDYNLTLYPAGKISGNLTSVGYNNYNVYVYDKYNKNIASLSVQYYNPVFSFDQLPNGTYWLAVGSTNTTVSVELNATTYINISLASSTTTDVTTSISGYITDSSGAILGATVKARAIGSTTFSTATTNATGYYQITSLSGNSYFVEATAEGYCPGTLTNFAATHNQDNTGANITLTKSATINGTITDSSTEPISGATITIYEINSYYPTEGYTDYAIGSVTSASNGSYVYTAKFTWYYSSYSTKNMPLYPGVYRVVVTKDGYAPAQATVTITTQGETVQQNFTLTPIGSIAGYVLTPSGVPINSYVNVYARSASTGIVKSAYYAYNTYNITNLPLDDYTLSVETTDYVLTTLNVSITTTGYAINQNITLIPKYYVEGYITDSSTGNPIPSAFVYIYKDTGTYTDYVDYTTTRDTGYFVMASMDSFGYYGVKITANSYITKYLPLYINSSNIALNTTLTKGSTITGTVWSNRGIPVSSGSVSLKTLNGVQVDSENLGSGGMYTFSSVPAGTYHIEVSIDYTTLMSVDVIVDSAELKYQNFTATYGYLEGNVTDSLGNPIVGATVSASGTSTPTDPNGHYLLHWTSNGTYTVTGSKGSYGCIRSVVSNVAVVKGATTYLDIVLANSAKISGYVTNENGQALTDIYCYIATIGKYKYTNSLGYYIFNEDLNASTYNISFTGGYYMPTSQNATVLLAGDDCLNNNVTMIVGGSISGAITNSYGGPISSITVYAYNAADTTNYVASTYTNTNGFYNITKLATGTYIIKTHSTDTYKENSKTAISVSLRQTTANQNITLEFQPTVSGFVSKSSGEPVYGATVTAYNTSQTSDYGSSSDTTTVSGYYNLKHLNDGTTYNIKTSAGTYAYTNTILGNATVVLGTQTTNTSQKNITMTKSAILFGYVTYNGAAMSGASVRLFLNSTEITSDTTSTNGLYFFTTNLKTGTYTVTIDKTGYAMVPQNVSLTEGTMTFLNISIVKSARIHGFLLDANNAPVTVEDIDVYISGQYMPVVTITDMKEIAFYSYSTSSRLVAGTYQIYATILGVCVWLNVTVATGESVIANLTSTRTIGVGNITGIVSDLNGTVIAGAAVDLSGQGGFRYTDTDSNGVYTFTNLTIGDYSLYAHKEGYGYMSGNVNATVETNKTTWANITLPPHICAYIVGYVNDSSGNAIANATVTLSKTGTTTITATTNATGYYMFSYVYGLYTINATKTGYNISSTTVNVTNSTTYYVNFTLSAVITTGTLKGFVKTSAGAAIQGATVTITGGQSTTTDNDGMYSFTENVTAGSYNVTATKTGYQVSTISAVAVTAGTTKWTNISMLVTGETDTIPPTVAITSPTNGAITRATAVNVTGTVSDIGGTVDGVWISLDNATWTLRCAVEGAAWYREIGLSAGSNTIYAKAADNSNNTAYTSVTVIVDNVQPAVAITSHATNTVVSTETINLVGTASDNVGLESVMISKNNETWNAVTGTTTWNATVTLSVGVNTIYIKATDTSGNRLFTSIKVARQEEIKTASPTAPIVVNLTVGVPYAFKLGAEQHTITVTDITSTTANVTIQSSPLTATLTIGEARLFDTNSNGQDDTKATLQSTNVTTSMANVSIISVQEDLVGPVVTISSQNNTVVKASKVKIEGTATDSNTISKVQYSTDGTTWTDATGTTSWSFEVELKEGINTISVKAIDKFNNAGDVKSIDMTYTKEKPPEPKKGWFLPGFEVFFLLAAFAVVLAVEYRRK